MQSKLANRDCESSHQRPLDVLWNKRLDAEMQRPKDQPPMLEIWSHVRHRGRTVDKHLHL